MAAKILFTNSYFYRFDKKQWLNQQPYPPYNTILAAAYVRQAGFEVALFDTNLAHSPNEIKQRLQNFKPDIVVIYDDSFNYLSKMCLTNMREACFELIKISKEFDCKVLINSSDATDHPELFLQQGANAVMLGEAEETLLQLLTTNTDNWLQVSGIATLVNTKLFKTQRRVVLNNLDKFPQPAWDLINVDNYKNIWHTHHHFFSLNIATTRGCPFKCNWCAKPIYGNRYNSRSPLEVVKELKLLMNEFGATHFWVCDDIFGLKPGWVKEFSGLLQKENLKPKLKIQCRADLLLEDDTIKNLVAAGLDEVWMGAESGSQKILNAMDKGTTVEQIYTASALLKNNGVKVCLFLQYGYLGETKEDINKTLNMVKEILPHDIGISVSYPLPGTAFYNMVKEQLKEKQNWRDSDDLAMLYKGTFNEHFYKKLQRHTHIVFRKAKGTHALKKLFVSSNLFSKTILKQVIKLPYHFILEKISGNKLIALQSSKP